MSDELLRRGITALRAGRKDEARQLLEQVLQTNPHSENGWLWFSAVADSDDERRFCLTQVVSVNPRNAAALQGLQRLGPGPIQSPLAEPPREPPALSVEPPSAAPVTGSLCQRCQTFNPPHYRFCDACGSPLGKPALDDTQPSLVRSASPQTPLVAAPQPGSAPAVSGVAPRPQPPVPALPSTPRPESKTPRPAGKGKWLSMGAAGVVLVCFFLPWITVSCTSFGLLGNDYVETWSGYDLASRGINLVKTVNVGDTQPLYLVLVAAILVFLILLFSGRRRVGGWMATIVTALSAIGGGALASIYAAIKGEIDEFISATGAMYTPGSYTLEMGFWGTVIGLVGMAVGAIADAVSRD